MESFFHTLKTELVMHCDYRTRDQARASLFDYVEVFYNRQRRHSTIKYESPLEFEERKPPHDRVHRSWARSFRPKAEIWTCGKRTYNPAQLVVVRRTLNQGANSSNGRTDPSIARGGGETMALKDYYSILGVSRTETARGIQSTFHELVKRLHRNRLGPRGTAAFQDLVDAYQVLLILNTGRLRHHLLQTETAAQRTPVPRRGWDWPQSEPLIPEWRFGLRKF